MPFLAACGYTLSEMFIGLAADIPFSQAKKEGPDS